MRSVRSLAFKVIALVLLILFPLTATAEVCQDAIPVTKPCVGVLLPEDLAADGIQCLDVDLPKAVLQRDAAVKESRILLEGCQKLYVLETARAKELSDMLKIAIKPVPIVEPSIFESKYFWASTGFLLGAGAAIGMAFALNSAK